MRQKHDHRGFGTVEVLLVTIIVLLAGFIGYYVYRTNQTAKNTTQPANRTQSTAGRNTGTMTTPKVPAGWQKYDGGSFSFSYPSDWIRKDCSAGLLLLGPTESSAGLCNSDATSEISIAWAIGDSRANYHLSKNDYPDLQEKTISIAGETATKVSGTLNSSQPIYVGPTNGTKVIQYLFYRKGQTYAFVYTQTPDFSDASNDFGQLVTKTLSFN